MTEAMSPVKIFSLVFSSVLLTPLTKKQKRMTEASYWLQPCKHSLREYESQNHYSSVYTRYTHVCICFVFLKATIIVFWT